VWRATDLIDGGQVALKSLRGRASATRLQARREVATLRALQVPGVVSLRDEGVDGGVAFLVMERVEGAPFPGGASPMSWAALGPRVFALLETLVRVHALGVVHGDLKPDNVLVHDGRVVLLDFGNAATDLAHRDEHERRGTARWMAPEAWDGALSPRSDLFAVAAMAHHALTGQMPYRVRGSLDTQRLRRSTDAPRTRWSAVSDLPARCALALEAALAPRPEDRPASAFELLESLRGDAPARADDALSDAAPLSEDALRAWFEGPERLLHLPEDAAKILYARCHGDPRVARRVLDGWVRDGLARRVGDRFAVRREDLDRLAADAPAHTDLSPRAVAPRLAPHHQDLVEWIALSQSPVDTATLSRLTRIPGEELSTTLRALSSLHAVVEVAPDAWATAHGRASRWPAGRRRDAHARYAEVLPDDAPTRLTHVLLGERPAKELSDALQAKALQSVVDGHIAAAEGALRAGVDALLLRPGVTDEELSPVFVTWFYVVLEQYVPRALDRLAYALCRAVRRHRGLRSLDRLARAAQSWFQGGNGARSVGARFRDAPREILRREVRLYAAMANPARLREEFVSFARRPLEEPSWARRLATWEGHLAYREHRFHDAVAHHLDAARDEPWAARRCRARLNAVAAAIEAHELDLAEHDADAVRAESSRLRLPPIEARAVYLQHLAAWRRGGVAPPDLAWVEAARQVDPQATRLLALNHGARAWSLGDHTTFARALELAEGTEGYSTETLIRAPFLGMSHEMGIVAMTRAERDRLVSDVALRVPRIALQVAALAASLGPLPPTLAETLFADADATPAALRGVRLDVMSVDEALRRLGR
jgi:Protein kinase domain